MSIFAESIEDSNLIDLPVELLHKVEWEYMDLCDFIEDFNNIIMLERLAEVYKDVKEDHIFLKLFEIAHHLDDETLEFITAHLVGIDYPDLSIGGSVFYDGRQLPREYVEKYADYMDLYNVERQGWIDPEFFEKYEHRMDVSSFWGNFNTYHTFENMKEWFMYSNGKYVPTMMEYGVCNNITAQEFTELGIPVPDCYNTVITAQRIMSGDPCNDGQRSFAIWLRKYRRVYNDPDGFPTWGNLIELCKKHPRMNNDGYVDWIHSRALFNSEEEVSNYPTELQINVRRIDDDDYARAVRDTSDDNPDVVVPEFRTEERTNDVAPTVNVHETMGIHGRLPSHAQVRFLDAPVGTFSPEMISIMHSEITPATPPEIARSIDEQVRNRVSRLPPYVEVSDYAINSTLIHPTYINPVLGTGGVVTPRDIQTWVENTRRSLNDPFNLSGLLDSLNEHESAGDDGTDEVAPSNEPDEPQK